MNRWGLAFCLLVASIASGCSNNDSAISTLTQEAQCQGAEWRLRRMGTVRDDQGIIIDPDARPDLRARADILADSLEVWRVEGVNVPPEIAHEFEASGEWDRAWQAAVDQSEADLIRMADRCEAFLATSS